MSTITETATGTYSIDASHSRVGFVAYDGRIYRLIGYSLESRWGGHERSIRRSLASFSRLTDPRALEVQPRRLRIVRADRSESLRQFADRHQVTVRGVPGFAVRDIDVVFAAGRRGSPGPHKSIPGRIAPIGSYHPLLDRLFLGWLVRRRRQLFAPDLRRGDFPRRFE